MEKATLIKKRFFYFATILSILFIPGILAIIFGSIYNMLWLTIVGCVIAIASFYGLPLLWVSYTVWSHRCRIIEVVKTEYTYSYSELAKKCGRPVKEIADHIKYLVAKGYLIGFTYDNEKLIRDSAADNSEYREMHVVKCPHCGAEVVVNDDTTVCDFCGSPLTEKS